MRTEQEMMDLILSFAIKDERIRVVGMEGSRTNKNVPKDKFQDYDITYVVTRLDTFTNSDEWLNYFGERIIMQKPEAMELFPPELGNWFSYLMLFTDGNRIDLTVVPLEELDLYLASDKLLKILLDKDQRIQNYPVPSDIDYHVKKPTAQEFDDCCNEFWWVSTYVTKGLCRKEILFANYHLESILRKELLRMISWMVGIDTNFSLSVGKNQKYLKRYLDDLLWKRLMSTYKLDTYENAWESLFTCLDIFRETSKIISQKLNYDYPDYDENITKYIYKLFEETRSN